MGKKGKGRRPDDDDFEIAVQSLEIADPNTAGSPPPAGDDEASELDELLDRALILGLLSEAAFDEVTDALAEGARTEAEVLAEWKAKLQQWQDEQDAANEEAEDGAEPPPSGAAAAAPSSSSLLSAAPRRRKNALRVLSSLDELDALTAAAGPEGVVIVKYTAKWCGQCKKIAPYYGAALPGEFFHVPFAALDVDDVPDAADRAGAEKLPLFEVLRGGKRVETMVGAQQTQLRRLVAKHAPPPPAAAAEEEEGGGEAGGGEASGGGEGGAGEAEGGEAEGPKRVNKLVVVGSAGQLEELYEEARQAEKTGEGSGLVVVSYTLRSDAGCKKVAPVYERRLPAEFLDVHFATVDIGAHPKLATRVGLEPPEAADDGSDKPSISQLGRKAKSHKGGGGNELPFFELLRGGKRVDSLNGPQATALRDKVARHRAASEDDLAKKKKKGKQAKAERQACGYTGGR